MGERREKIRERVIYGATAAVDAGRSRPCVVRNFSDSGAHIVFSNDTKLPGDIALKIERKGRSYQARVIWWRNNSAGVAFAENTPSLTPADADLEERLRRSEKKTRQLKRRVRELLGEG